MCFCFLCLVCPVLQVYLDCLSLVFSNVYLVHLCSLFNGQLTNSSFLWILFVLFDVFRVYLVVYPFSYFELSPIFGIELSPILGIELYPIFWYWLISHFWYWIIFHFWYWVIFYFVVLSYLPFLGYWVIFHFFGIELSPIFLVLSCFPFFGVLIGSTADQPLCVILFIDTSKKKYTSTIFFYRQNLCNICHW